ncbi:MAG TPA: FMN-binding protein [Desulfitobacterium dehalogenans]|uniref:FMN-binding protein n=1 Tax=Desulfitobacterium dehalogenans TaxID=36854 RepID=A0A7C7D8Q9_9FIRM|nr:FMN-binding protein [Desulfitobacterium dehalogenans]
MIGFILDYVFGWLAVLIGIFLISKYLFRKLIPKVQGEKRSRLVEINRYLKTPHIVLGFVLIVISLIHGAHSSDPVLSVNIGTLNWLVTIALGISWVCKNLKTKWLPIHQALTILFVVTLVWHIVDVGGINIFRILSEMNSDVTYEAMVEEQQKEDNTSNNISSNPVPNQVDLPYYFSFKGLELANGTYITESTGYSPGLKLEVTIENNFVKKIKILQHFEVDSKYYKEAMLVIPAAILKQQTLEVDAITGSSMTSIGIIKGVRKAVLDSMEKYNEEQIGD